MFGHLTGKIIDIKPTRVILETAGIGWVINSTPMITSELHVGSTASFWTHTAVRENSIELYGFQREEDLRMFELLLGVSGIGPKSALAIITAAKTEAIEEAILANDISVLTGISGIGRKTAEKIVVELRGKIQGVAKGREANGEALEVYEALKSLGYRDRDIQNIIQNLPTEISGTNEKIKYALKNLGK